MFSERAKACGQGGESCEAPASYDLLGLGEWTAVRQGCLSPCGQLPNPHPDRP